MSGTPRTDAEANCFDESGLPAKYFCAEVVLADFARDLERENADLRARLLTALQTELRLTRTLIERNDQLIERNQQLIAISLGAATHASAPPSP